jgi:ubiquitin-conjugating enzyme E2 S
LDEEAGRLLLENYDEYHRRAKLWTDIHAKNKPAGLFEPDQSSVASFFFSLTSTYHKPPETNQAYGFSVLFISSSNTSESIPTSTTTDSKPTMQPFASSNQVNNKQARLGGTAATTTTTTTTNTTTVLKSQQSDHDDERVMKANSLLPATTNTAHPIDGENLIPSPLSNNPKQPYPIPTTTTTTAAAAAAANLKDKDRRGRKRL